MTKKTAAKSEWNKYPIIEENGTQIVLRVDGVEKEGEFFVENGDYYLLTNEEQFQIGISPGIEWKLKPSDTDAGNSKTTTTDQDKTKSRRLSLEVTVADLHRYIAAGLYADNGATVSNMWTNADEKFIVYGSGLGKVG